MASITYGLDKTMSSHWIFANCSLSDLIIAFVSKNYEGIIINQLFIKSSTNYEGKKHFYISSTDYNHHQSEQKR